MSEQKATATNPVGAEGAQIKQKIADDKGGAVDVGASMLGTDNEAGAMPDDAGMAEARNAPPPA